MNDEIPAASAPPGKLPPMTALEFAIASTFRHFLFSARLIFAWAIVMLPLAVGAYLLVFRDGLPGPSAPPPAAIATGALLCLVLLLAAFSIAVNWHRRLVLGETPRRFAWVRLDGVVWRYVFGVLFVLTAIALMAGAAVAAFMFLPSQFALGLEGLFGTLSVNLGLSLDGLAYLAAALIGLSAFFTLCRLASWLPALALNDKDYTLRKAWRATRNNRLAYLGYTFWLLFTLAIAGALGAGAYFVQRAMNDIYATAAAFAFIALLAWLAMFLILSIATSHYYHFSGRLKDIADAPEQ